MANYLHKDMMFKTLHADLLNFIDKIPIARLINRFSNDIN